MNSIASTAVIFSSAPQAIGMVCAIDLMAETSWGSRWTVSQGQRVAGLRTGNYPTPAPCRLCIASPAF
ncbi:MAG TPA: hypothetical protein VNG04_14175, partial [Candidatus Acidoferrum sp.]|nr:hypothetical protein [Candidatus Acidoferrum sp.]